MGPPKRRGAQTEDEAALRPLEPYEIAEVREGLKERRHRIWLRGVIWKVLGWGGASVVLFTSLKDEIISWFNRGSP
jgi:hypothetical protein